MNLELLFRAVYEAPHDEVRRQVLADALQMISDPRGDFIALQLRDSVISRRRSEKLLARHRTAFLGPLAAVVVNSGSRQNLEAIDERWDKGFLVECTARLSGATADCLEWATVQTLHVYEQQESPDELASPRLSSLQKVLLYGSDEFAERARALLSKARDRNLRVTHVERYLTRRRW